MLFQKSSYRQLNLFLLKFESRDPQDYDNTLIDELKFHQELGLNKTKQNLYKVRDREKSHE